MAITYTTLATETLPNDQTRTLRAYDVTGGVILNVLVEHTLSRPYVDDIKALTIDEELFVPKATVALLAGISFTVENTVNLDQGQKRIIEGYEPASGGKIVLIIRTLEFKEAPGAPSKTVVIMEKLSFVAPLTQVGRVSLTGDATYLGASFQDMVLQTSGALFQADFDAMEGDSIDVHLLLNLYSTGVTLGTAEVRLTLNDVEIGWQKLSYTAATQTLPVAMSVLVPNLGVGPRYLKVQIKVAPELFSLHQFYGVHRGKLEYRLHR